MIVLVTGGRNFRDAAYINRTLDHLHAMHRFTFLMNGKAGGVDKLSTKWAIKHRVQPVEMEALWDAYGTKAGTIRNGKMLEFRRPDLVVAFPGGTGTANMIRQSNEGGISFVCTEDMGMHQV